MRKKNVVAQGLVCIVICLAFLTVISGCSRQKELIAESKEKFDEQLKATADAIYAEAEAEIQAKTTPSPTPEPTPSVEDYINYGAALEAIEQLFDGAVADFYDETELSDSAIKEIKDNKNLRINFVVTMSSLFNDGTITEEKLLNSVNESIAGYVEFVMGYFE